MDNINNEQYLSFTDLHFAVWNMIKPINFIWVDFVAQCVRYGVKDDPTDPIEERKKAEEAKKDTFVELIKYDTDGKPILGFDDEETDEPYALYPVSAADLSAFLSDMEDIDLLGWRNQFPSLREGLCWRIDVYYKGGEKHMSGQTRFPPEWAAFGKSLNGLVKKAQQGAKQ